MTPEQIAEIRKLAAAVTAKREEYEWRGMMNVPATLEKRQAQSADYTVARAEYWEACSALNRAMPTQDDVMRAEQILRELSQPA